METMELTDELEQGARRLEAFARLGAAVHRRSYAPGKWTGQALLAHVSDADFVFYGRFLKAVAEEGYTIQLFDHERWMAELKAAERPVAVSIGMIQAIGTGLAHHLSTLPTILGRAAQHPERGRMTALDIATSLIRHRQHHLGQMDAIAAGREWTVAERVPY